MTKSKWPMVKLGQILTPESTTERINNTQNETFVTIKLHGRGAVERNIGIGKTPKPFTGFRVKSGQFIYSRIDARNGAFAIIPPELDGAVVSKDFPVFSIDPSIDSDFLNLFCTTPVFEKTIQAKSNGATNRQRIKEGVLLSLKVPLPPLEEQKRIANILSLSSDGIEKAELLLDELGTLQNQLVEKALAKASSFVPLSDIAEVTGGLTLGHRSNKPISVPYLRVANVFRGRISTEEIKELQATEQEISRTQLQFGDCLVVEAHGNRGEVGRAAMWEGKDETMSYQNHLFRVRVHPEASISPEILPLILNSRSVRKQVWKITTTTSGLNTTSIAKIRTLRIPALTPELVNQLTKVHSVTKRNASQIERLQVAAGDLYAALSTRAFRGEL